MMFPAALGERIDALIDELILDGGVEAASLASILLAARDSVTRDDHVTLSRRVWAANNDLLPRPLPGVRNARPQPDAGLARDRERRLKV